MGNLGFAAFLELLITLLFCLTLYNTLNLVRPDNRVIKPWQIWLLFIPLLNILWNFVVVTGVSNSLRKELISRDYEVAGRPGFLSGILYSVLSLIITIVFYTVPLADMASKIMEERAKDAERPLNQDEILIMCIGFAGILRLVFFVQFWMKINWYKNVLKSDLTEGTS